jgi:serine/threonine-protein kinase
MIDLRGKVLDRKYRLVRLIGEGGMGSVYEAEHTRLHRRAAVKVLHTEHSDSVEAVDRFLREAMAASAIGHPNIVEVYDVGQEDDGTTFIVMELLEGRDLGTLLTMEDTLQPARVVALVLQMLSALHEAHRLGIVHRDMKPDNVFVSVDPRLREEVRLLDFGVAKIQGHLEGTEAMRMTRTGVTLGTPYYIAPEQARGRRDVDARIDLWAVGVMMYEMLAGVLPFEGEGYNEIISNVLLEDHLPLRRAAPGVPRRLAEVVERALVKDRDVRYQTAGEMIGDLLPLHDEQSAVRLTSQVDSALRRHSDPPPPPDVETVVLEAHAAYVADPRDSSTKTWLLNSDVPDPGAKPVGLPRLAKLAAISAGVCVLALVVVAALVLPGRSADQAAAPLTAEQEAAAPQAQDTRRTEQPAAPGQAAVPEPVVVELRGLPAGAEVSIDGRAVQPPIELRASGEPIILKVTATGYHSYERALVPDRNLLIDVSMVLTKPGAKPGAPRKGKRAGARKRGGMGEVWAENPFSE